MLAFIAAILLSATDPADSSPESNSRSEIESSEMELVLDEEMDDVLQSEDIALDDSILSDAEIDLLEIDE